MKKFLIFIMLLAPSIFADIASAFFPSVIDSNVLNIINLLGSILSFIAWAFLFWTLGGFFQAIWGASETEFPGIISESIKLYIDELGFDVHGKLLSSKEFDENTPLVFLLTGGGGKHMNFYGMGALFVKFGVKAFLFDHPGKVGESHGTTPESKIRSPSRSILTLKKMIDYAVSRPDIKTDKIGLFGGSLGAFTIVYGGFTDERIKIIIGQATGLIETAEEMEQNKKKIPWWFKKFCQFIKLNIDDLANMDYDQFSDPKYKHLRNRVYLIHCMDDNAVQYTSFLKLKGALELPDENCLVFEKGGHGFLRHQGTILGWIMGKFKKHLFETKAP